MADLPDPTTVPNEIFRNKTTGQILRSDGTRWLPISTEQGPSIGQQMLRGGILAGSALAPMAIPGSGSLATMGRLGAEVLMPMLAETGMQEAGIAPKSGADIGAAGLTPMAARLALGAPGLARGASRGATGFFLPQQMRETGVGLVQKQFAGPRSKALFEVARKQGPISTRPVIRSVGKALTKERSMSTPNRPAVRLLENIQAKFLKTPESSYDDLIDEVQRLRQAASGHFKRGNNVTGTALNRARAEILDEMDKISPGIKAANAAFRRENAIIAISKELRKQNAGASLRTLFERDELISRSFSASERTEILDIADRIARLGTGVTMGAANRFIQASAEVVAESMQEPRGRALLEILMRNPLNTQWVNRWSAVLMATTQVARGTFFRFGQEEQQQQIIQGGP